MDTAEGPEQENDQVEEENDPSPKPRPLPDDLPTSLDDRRPATFDPGVEVYDAWQGI